VHLKIIISISPRIYRRIASEIDLAIDRDPSTAILFRSMTRTGSFLRAEAEGVPVINSDVGRVIARYRSARASCNQPVGAFSRRTIHQAVRINAHGPDNETIIAEAVPEVILELLSTTRITTSMKTMTAIITSTARSNYRDYLIDHSN